MRLSALFIGLLSMAPAFGQVLNTGFVDTAGGEHLGKVSIAGYVDIYGNNCPAGKSVPYMVSSARGNEITANLVFLDFRYRSENIRARLVPAFGTYMNANLAGEPGTLKNLLEASAGIRVSKKYNVWLDAGILGSPYTNENPVSKDQLLYTRSMSAENSPYYLSGLKLGLPLSENLHFYAYLINGWQQIQDYNSEPAFGSQLEWNIGKNHLINWNTYVGNEESTVRPNYMMRYFTDLYWIGKLGKRWDASACVYAGIQNYHLTLPADSIFGPPPHLRKRQHRWWNANAQLRYTATDNFSISARAEWFNDPGTVFQTPMNTTTSGYKTGSYSLCLNRKVNSNALLRLEYRRFFAETNQSYYLFGSFYRNNMDLLTGSMAVWF